MTQSGVSRWTNRSVLQFAAEEDPIAKMEKRVRDVVLKARDAGWNGPPFNPVGLARILNIPVDPTTAVVDARTISGPDGLRIQYNPQQARERARFSIAHEIAHTFFDDVADATRHRGGDPAKSDDWQLEMLCNLAAAEMVMPIGSLPPSVEVPTLEELLRQRLQYDVSIEAFLMRIVRTAEAPVSMFVASPRVSEKKVDYSIDYAVSSGTAPKLKISGKRVPESSVVRHCTAIGATSHADEDWLTGEFVRVETVGIAGYPGSSYPRVAGLARHSASASEDVLRYIQGNVLSPTPNLPLVICQITNDRAVRWGGGVAKQAARKFPAAEQEYSDWIKEVPRPSRLGDVHFAKIDEGKTLASLIAQEGIGVSQEPRIRYWALNSCLQKVAKFAGLMDASVHMPRIGTGAAQADWAVVEGLLRATFSGLKKGVWIYDPPPRQTQQDLGF